MDHVSFTSKDKALLVAPAGYGKTFTLAECLQYTTGKSLVLTHTHAGVASIKKKLKEAHIHSSKYSVETISSFAQKYTKSFYMGSDIPTQEDTKTYHPFIIKKASVIFSIPLVKKVIQITYSGLFVDEYQDCSKEHHQMLSELMNYLPTRIFGDPLQGVFDFNGELVDFNIDLADFEVFPSLAVPHRWNQVGAYKLGKSLKTIRKKLEDNEEINLNDYKDSIEIIVGNESDIYDRNSAYFKKLNGIKDEKSLLVIHPNSMNKHPRIKFSKSFKGIRLIESIDDKDFYKLAKMIDNIAHDTLILDVRELSYLIFNKTGLNNWFNERALKKKKNEKDRERVSILLSNIQSYQDFRDVIGILKAISDLPDVHCSRQELLKSLFKAIEIAALTKISVIEGMREQRNKIRRSGRRVEGRHIGTTLLTKGLEFDVVAILDAQKFTSPKHLYVALTRCRKRLIVFTNNPVLSPY